MFDLLGMLKTATSVVGTGDIALAAPYELSDYHCRSMVNAGVIKGYLLSGPPKTNDFDPRICGWWVDRQEGLWFLRDTVPPTIVLLNARQGDQLTGQMLIEAQLKGVHRILLADVCGNITGTVNPREEIIARLALPASTARYADTDYHRIFDSIYSNLSPRFRLNSIEFVPGRVMLLVGSLGPGGAERQTAYTAAGLARRGVEVVVGLNYLEPPNDLNRPLVERAGVRICVAPVGDAEFDTDELRQMRENFRAFDNLAGQSILEQVFHYALMIRELRPTILHTWLDYGNVLGGIAAQLVGVPHLLMSGRNVAIDNFPNIFSPYMKPGYSWLQAQRHLTMLNNSKAGGRDYARWLEWPEREIRIIHNGFEFPDLIVSGTRNTIRESFGIPPDAFVVGSMARFAEEKNPQLFVDAARLLSEQFDNIYFLGFGIGPLRDGMLEYVEGLGLGKIILLPGITEDVWSAMSAMDVFVLTSRMEGLPNVLVEAQASGLPVVSTRVGGAPETFLEGKTGLAVNSANAEELADAIALLYQNIELRQAMSAEAAKFVRTTFNIDRMIDATLAVYRDSSGSRGMESTPRQPAVAAAE